MMPDATSLSACGSVQYGERIFPYNECPSDQKMLKRLHSTA
jgi:hypothetical protein